MITTYEKMKVIEILAPSRPKMIGIFGSFARSEDTLSSDIDILFAPQADIGFFQLSRMRDALAALFQKEVDLVTDRSLSPFLASTVHKDLQVIYES